MTTELNLRFPDQDHVIVRFDDQESGSLAFADPLTDNDRGDIRWYIEMYGTRSLNDDDDKEADRIAKLLPQWGKKLFEAVFREREARRLFNRFQDGDGAARLLTISAEGPAILGLPWELLHDPDGVHLFFENPSISIRRRVAGSTKGRRPFKINAKDRLHLLFVVSRPEGSGFLDPRADPRAVLDALDAEAPGRVTWEFLQPATFDGLIDRLRNKSKPAVDVLHFDGHGIFDRHGGLPRRVEERQASHPKRIGELLRDEQNEAEPLDHPDQPPNTGYLLFEKEDRKIDCVSAAKLGENLHQRKVALVILSACQSAAVRHLPKDEEEPDKRPMGSMAARLTAAGIPAVLAMTHSVLVPTTRALFGQFYKQLACHNGLGESLDAARQYLKNNPKKYEVQRETGRVWLELHDWFLPALYQSGADVPLLKEPDPTAVPSPPPQRPTNLPDAPEAGFFGRLHELWDVECWFADGTRRITLTGFGGQGKTALALEAGRWLTRIGRFQAAVFVDYSRIQALDAVTVAVGNIGSVLGESLSDARAVTEALKKTPTLVILDNLEALAPEPLAALLDAAAEWSQAGDSRLLCTTRRPEFGHDQYAVTGTLRHRRKVLDALGSRQAPDDALAWFKLLTDLPPAPTVKKPPTREALIELFDRVKFHPLSIRVLTQQLKTRGPAELGQRLEELLVEAAGSSAALDEDTPAGLLASLQLSLEQLDTEAQAVLPRLGVFQGGACEDDLLAITEIPEGAWPALRQQLEGAALIEPESMPGVGVPFLRFHPTLAPLLWAQLDADEQARLSAAHRQRYYALAGYLYHGDKRNPHQARDIARHELPNLLDAVHATLDAAEPDAVDFADSVNRFLGVFGFKQESEALVAKAQAAAGEPGSRAWYLTHSNRGEQLLAAGQVAEAAEIFQAVLAELGDTPRHERAVTLGRLGRCFRAGGRSDLAAQHYQDAIATGDKLEQTDSVKRDRGVLLTDLADVLAIQGKYAEARKTYEEGIEVAKEVDDLRQQGVVLGQLGTLAMFEGNLSEAEQRYRGALTLFEQLREPASEAVVWHQLGMVFHKARQWDEAERHYREAARICQHQGNLGDVALTWNQLATVTAMGGKPDAAETWFRKAIEVDRALDNPKELARDLSNLADLLESRPGRLVEARLLAEEALTIKQTIDPGAAQIWKIYNILAKIAEREAAAAGDATGQAELQASAREYRRLARDAKRNFAGTRHELQRHLPLILGVVAAVEQPEARAEFEQLLKGLKEGGLTEFVAAIRQILAGERDEEALCDGLDPDDSMIVETILRGLADPSTLEDLLPSDDPQQQ